jgi:hypothetical protein
MEAALFICHSIPLIRIKLAVQLTRNEDGVGTFILLRPSLELRMVVNQFIFRL